MQTCISHIQALFKQILGTLDQLDQAKLSKLRLYNGHLPDADQSLGVARYYWLGPVRGHHAGSIWFSFCPCPAQIQPVVAALFWLLPTVPILCYNREPIIADITADMV